jgi:hypothetical protein
MMDQHMMNHNGWMGGGGDTWIWVVAAILTLTFVVGVMNRRSRK